MNPLKSEVVLPQPYLLFLGDTTEPGYAKTAFGLRDWAGERCVGEYVIEGLRSNLSFHRWIVNHPRFVQGDIDTGFIAQEWRGQMAGAPTEERVAMIAAAVQAENDRRRTATAPPRTAQGGGNRWRFQQRSERG